MPKAKYFITHNGETQTVSYWAKKLGMSYSSIRLRLDYGWDPIEAITTPSKAVELKERALAKQAPKAKFKKDSDKYRDAWKEKKYQG